MNRTTLLILGMTSLTAASAQTANPNLRATTVRDPQVIVSLLKGNVQMIGSSFPNKTFQAGVLTLLRGRKITVNVLTTREAAPSLSPLKASGARIQVMPKGAKMTGNAVLVGTDTAIMSLGNDAWYVMQGPNVASTITLNLAEYMPYVQNY